MYQATYLAIIRTAVYGFLSMNVLQQRIQELYVSQFTDSVNLRISCNVFRNYTCLSLQILLIYVFHATFSGIIRVSVYGFC